MRVISMVAMAAATLALPAAVAPPVQAQSARNMFVGPQRPMMNPNMNMMNMNMMNMNMRGSSMFRPAFSVSSNVNNGFMNMRFPHWRWHGRYGMNMYPYAAGYGYGGYGGLYGYGGMYGLGSYGSYSGTYGPSYGNISSYRPVYGEKSSYDSGKPAEKAPAPIAEPSVNVAIFDGYFEPKEITIAAGTTVRWTNLGQQNHEVVSDDGLRDSGKLSVQVEYTRKFNEPGTYTYHCEKHPEMRGTVIVR